MSIGVGSVPDTHANQVLPCDYHAVLSRYGSPEDVGYVDPDDLTTATEADYASANGSIVSESYEAMPALSFTYERAAHAGNPTLYDASSGQPVAYTQAMASGQPGAYEQAMTGGQPGAYEQAVAGGQPSAYEQAMAGGQPSTYEQAATAGPSQANGRATGERRETAWSRPAGQQNQQNAKKKKKTGIKVCTVWGGVPVD